MYVRIYRRFYYIYYKALLIPQKLKKKNWLWINLENKVFFLYFFVKIFSFFISFFLSLLFFGYSE